MECNITKSEIIKYVDNYKKGMLDPYQYEPKENGFIDEEEEDFIGGL